MRRVPDISKPQGSFLVAREGQRKALTATIRKGVSWPLIGRVIDRMLLRTIGGRIRCICKHQQEEGLNLKVLIENGENMSR